MSKSHDSQSAENEFPGPTHDVHEIGVNTQERIVRAANCSELKEHGIALIGLTHAAVPYEIVRVNLDGLHFHVCTHGQGLAWVEGRWEIFQQGDAYLNPNGSTYALKAIPNQKWSFSWVIYRGIRTWQQRLPRTSIKIPGIGLTALHFAIEGIYQETSRAKSHQNLRASWANLINSYCHRLAEERVSFPRLSPLWEMVDQSLVFPWSVPELSRKAGLSREQLRRIAKLETGLSPMAQVTKMRMDRAIALLETRTMKVQAVAEMVGYSDACTFSTAFARWTGHPPSFYLK